MEEKEIMTCLEETSIRLENDIQALGYIMGDYFDGVEPKEGFNYSYKEIQNRITTLFKSMNFNYANAQKILQHYLKKEEGVVNG